MNASVRSSWGEGPASNQQVQTYPTGCRAMNITRSPKREGGHRTVDNSLLAHRLCNRVGYAKSVGNPYDGDVARAETARQAAIQRREHL